MNYKMMGKFVGHIALVEGVFMIPALFIGMYHHETKSIIAFLITMAIIGIVSAFLLAVCRNSKKMFYAKEGLTCVGLSWMVLGVLGALPFVISGSIPNFIDAVFESVSGFTTTGASILTDVEVLPRSILYWRSFTHWLGGMGVLVFVLAIAVGSEGKSGFTMHLLRAESPGPKVGKLVPRMKRTAEILYLLYIILTVLDFIFLMIGNMPVFDAVCTALGTAGTGGFGVRNDSIAGYSPYIQNVCTVFMLLFGVNFSCYYLLLLGQVKNVFKDEELRIYLGLVFGSIALIVWNLRGFYDTLGETIRYAAFQVATVMSTTGFATADFDQWPAFSKAILMCLMFVGASAGSTAGGFKVGRLMLLMKDLRRKVRKSVNPNRVEIVRNNGDMIDEDTLANCNSYLVAYVLILVFSFLLLSLNGFSQTTTFSAVVSCFNNIGPGFEGVGPTCNFASFSWFSKVVLIFDMLAGRLEIFPILILFSKSTWRRR